MGRGLVGHQDRHDVAGQQVGEDGRGVADQADGAGFARLGVVRTRRSASSVSSLTSSM